MAAVPAAMALSAERRAETANETGMVTILRSTMQPPSARRVSAGDGAGVGRRWFPIAIFAVSAGCAAAPRPAPTTAQLEPTVLELRAKNAGQGRRIEELENRIFILEDQLDSRKLAAEQRAPPTLPARVPRQAEQYGQEAAPAVAPRGPGDDGAGATQTSIIAEHAVDYSGDAVESAPASVAVAPPTGARPVLRLSRGKRESAAQISLPSRAPEPLPDLRPAAAVRPGPGGLKVYRAALETLRAGDPDAARVAFRGFLDGNPQHDYADNAQYWIGECYYTQREFRAAERAFRKVVERYPRGNKVPDAMLKLGFTLQLLGDEVGGRAVLESLLRAFPRHETARLAVARLGQPPLSPPPSSPPPPSPSPSRVADAPALGTIVPAPLSSAGAGVVVP